MWWYLLLAVPLAYAVYRIRAYIHHGAQFHHAAAYVNKPYFSKAELDESRKLGDPLADAVIEALGVFNHDKKSAARANFHNFCLDDRVVEAANDKSHPAHAPCRALLDQIESVPEWLDQKKLEEATAFYRVHGADYSSGLLPCLVMSYLAPNGAYVLTRTGRLCSGAGGEGVGARLFETGQFVNVAMQTGHRAEDEPLGVKGVNYGQMGLPLTRVFCRRVRLLHAMVRAHCYDTEWDDKRGVPVNQEDMMGTLFLFGILAVNMTEKSGVSISDSQREAVLHLWRYCGHCLGCLPPYLAPMSRLDTANAASLQIGMRQVAPCDTARMLTYRLLTALTKTYALLPAHSLARWVASGLSFSMGAVTTRYYIGRRTSDALHLPPFTVAAYVGIAALYVTNVLLDRVIPGGKRLQQWRTKMQLQIGTDVYHAKGNTKLLFSFTTAPNAITRSEGSARRLLLRSDSMIKAVDFTNHFSPNYTMSPRSVVLEEAD